MQDPDMAVVPRISPPVLRWFRGYSRRYLQRHFTAVRQLRQAPAPEDQPGPLVVYFNHPAWWDPLMALFLASSTWPARRVYAPMAARSLERYGFFRKLGCFPVEQGSLAGARQFLDTARAVVSAPDTALWLTPQGAFTDVRRRPIELQPGLGHLATSLTAGQVVPLAVEYVFWDERLPEALVAWGEPRPACELRGMSAREATGVLAAALEDAQDRLAEAAIHHDEAAFDPLLAGRVGIGGIYDAWRRWGSRLRRQTFDPAHGGEQR